MSIQDVSADGSPVITTLLAIALALMALAIGTSKLPREQP